MLLEDDPEIRDEIDESIAAIDSIVSQCNLSYSLLSISRMFFDAAPGGIVTTRAMETGVYPWLLSYLAERVITLCADETAGKVEFSRAQYDRIVPIYYGLTDLISKCGPESTPVIALNIDVEQMFWQENVASLVPRYYSLFHLAGNGNEEIERVRTKLRGRFETSNGITIFDNLRNAMAIMAVMKKQRHGGLQNDFSLEGDVTNLLGSSISPERTQRFIKKRTWKLKDLKEYVVQAESKIPFGKQYILSPFFVNPFVSTGRAVIAPLPRMVYESATHGMYFKLLTEAGKVGDKAVIQFGKEFGMIFDDLVGQLLGTMYPRSEILFTGEEFREKLNQKGHFKGKVCDWVILLGSDIVLIETKSSRFTRDVIESWDIEAFKSFLASKYLNIGVEQLYNTRVQLRRVYDSAKVYSLLVYNDSFSMMNSLELYLDKGDDNLRKIREHDIQFMAIHELEHVIPSRVYPLNFLMRQKLKTVQAKVLTFDRFYDALPNNDFSRTIPIYDDVMKNVFGYIPKSRRMD